MVVTAPLRLGQRCRHWLRKPATLSALPRESLVLPFVSYLLASYPDRQIQLEMVELSAGLRKFRDGKLDFLLTNIHEEDDLTGFERLTFGGYDAKVVVSLLHPWAIKDSIGVEDMRKEVFIKMKIEEDRRISDLSIKKVAGED